MFGPRLPEMRDGGIPAVSCHLEDYGGAFSFFSRDDDLCSGR